MSYGGGDLKVFSALIKVGKMWEQRRLPGVQRRGGERGEKEGGLSVCDVKYFQDYSIISSRTTDQGGD